MAGTDPRIKSGDGHGGTSLLSFARGHFPRIQLHLTREEESLRAQLMRARSPSRLAATVIFDSVRPDETMPSTALLMRLTSAPRFSPQARTASMPDRSCDDTSAVRPRWA